MLEIFFEKLLKRTAVFDKVTVDVDIEESQISLYLRATRDFSSYSNELLPFLLDKKEDVILSKLKSKFYFLGFSEKDNFIHLKEREILRKRRDLKKIVFSVHKFFFFDFNTIKFYFICEDGRIYVANRWFFKPRYHLLGVDFSKVVSYKKKTVPPYVKLQKQKDLFGKNINTALLEVLGFPYLNRQSYFPLSNFEFNKHSLIIGQTGTGKSKFIEFFIKEMVTRKVTDEYIIVVIDPHAALYTNFTTLDSVSNIDFQISACKLFSQFGEPKVATELTILLFKTLMGEQFNAKTERVLKYALHALFVTQKMSLENLRDMLTQVEIRKEIIADSAISVNIRQFFDTDFIELQTRSFEVAIMPILALIDEMSFLPINNFQDTESLQNILNNNSIVFLSLSQIQLGQKALRLIAGLLTQQIFLLAQSNSLKKKVLFFIDEVSVVQNESLASILSEARKFGLSLMLSQQYLQQVDANIMHSMMANIYNYFIFKVSEDDAKMVVNNIEFDFPEEILKEAYGEKGEKEADLRIKFATTLNPRECLVRVYSQGKFYPVFKCRTVNMN